MIKIVGKSPLSFDSSHIISQLYIYIEKDVVFYTIFREVLMIYGESYLFNTDLFENDKEVFITNYPDLKNYDFENFFNIVESTFNYHFKDNEEGYKQFRGDFTEFIITKTGPYLHDSFESFDITREATFYEDSEVIQADEKEHHNNLDVCFHTENEFSAIEDIECEALECKIKLGNFLRERILDEHPMRKKDRQDRNKVKYMESLGNYFDTSKKFVVAFATLANNIEFPRKLLEQFPSTKIELVSGEMIANSIKNNLV